VTTAGRHIAAALTALPVLAIVPWVASRTAWALSSLFGEAGGIGACCTAAPVVSTRVGLLSNPFQPGLLVALLFVVIGGAVTHLTSRRSRAAWIIAPATMSFVAGGLLGGAAWHGLPDRLSHSVPVTIALTTAACVAMVATAYVSVLWATRSTEERA
jgi:hypothetical protein